MNIIVTGAGRGIGAEIVKRFASSPEHTIVAISRNVQNLNSLASECSALPGSVHTIRYDITSTDMATSLIPALSNIISSVDILINNAGVLVNKPFIEITDDDLHKVYSTNIFGPFQLIQSLFSFLKKSSHAHIVNISSMGGFQGSAKFKGLSAYSSSKAAITCLTECLAEEFKDENIKVNCLAIGAVQTEMLEEAFPGYKAPLTAAQMAEFVVDFSLKGSKFFNGKILPVSISTP